MEKVQKEYQVPAMSKWKTHRNFKGKSDWNDGRRKENRQGILANRKQQKRKENKKDAKKGILKLQNSVIRKSPPDWRKPRKPQKSLKSRKPA